MVQLNLEEKRQLCLRIENALPLLRRTLRLSQARFGELAGISRARIILVENKKAHLSWGQVTGILFLCFGDQAAKELFYSENLLGPRFLQYMQQKDANIPPQTNICVHEELMDVYRAQFAGLTGSGTVLFTKEERRNYCAFICEKLPDIRRVLQMSQATMADLAGISRARLIQLEKKKVPLSWSQMTSLLCVCMVNQRAKEYLYANNVLTPRFLQYVQRKDACTPPDTNICVSPALIMSYAEMLRQNAAM